jgi:Xaa-Pro aminopeptidase
VNRLVAALQALEENELGALIISAPSNIRSLSGFSGTNGTLVLRSSGATLLTDSRYAARAHDEVEAAGAEVEIVIAPGTALKQVVELLEGIDAVGLEASHISWAEANDLKSALGDTRGLPTTGLIEELREIKDSGEIELMKQAAAIADAALSRLLVDFGPGASEREVAQRLERLVLEGGADDRGFETIVASGPHSARPHHQATSRLLEEGDLVIIDFGAELGGYRSDMTRSFVLGAPSQKQAELLEGVKAAQQAGVDAVGVGVPTSSIDSACRTHLAAIGLGKWFTHGTGHGVGLDIHEAPSVSAKGTATLAAGHVITVEPGAYIPDFGGVRWEDTVVVTTSGAEPLTRSVKQPVVS